MDGEYEADARRLIRCRGVNDRWRRIDRLLVVTTGLMSTIVAAGLVAALLLVTSSSIVIFGEGRRNGYAADHRGDDERHHDLADCRTKLPGSRIRGSHSDLPFLE
jgi:hypothetical protein